MRSIVRDYASENPHADYDSIVKRFGNPQRIAESCIVEMETTEILQIVQLRNRIFQIVLVAAVMMATVWCGFTAAAYMDHFNDINGYMIIEEIEVENRTIIDEGDN